MDIFENIQKEVIRSIKIWEEREMNHRLQIECYQNEIAQLKSQLNNNQISSEKKINVLKGELNKRSQIIKELSITNETARNHEDVNEKLRNECSELSAHLKEKCSLLTAYKERIASYQGIIEGMKREHTFQLKDEKGKQNGLRNQLKKAKKRLEDKEKNNSFEKEAVALRNEHEKKHQEEIDALKREHEQKKTAMEKILCEEKQKNIDFQNEIGRLQGLLLATQEEKPAKDPNKEKLKELNSRITELEKENLAMIEELKKSETKYNNLLLLPGGRHELLVQNEKLKDRINEIEECFDEAWAGFRLEVFNYEKKIEHLHDEIETNKAEKEGRVYERTEPRFEDTGPGVFCMMAMEELQHLFHLSERSHEYVEALAEIRFHASNFRRENAISEENKESVNDVNKKNENNLKKSSSSDTIKENAKEQQLATTEESIEVPNDHQNQVTKNDSGCNIKQNDGDDDKEANNGDNDEEANDGDDNDDDEEANDGDNDEEANDGDNDEEANDGDNDEEANDGDNDEETNDGDNDEEANDEDDNDDNEEANDGDKQYEYEDDFESDDDDDFDNDDVSSNLSNNNSMSPVESLQEDNEEENIDDETCQDVDKSDDDEEWLEFSLNLEIPTFENQSDYTLSSILKKDKRKESKHHAVRFDKIVDLGFLIDDDTKVEKGDYVEVLKPPHEKKWEIPKISILDTPPAERPPSANFRFQVLHNIPKPADGDNVDGEKITATDIFGNLNKGDDEANEEDSEFDAGELDDAIDFILNM